MPDIAAASEVMRTRGWLSRMPPDFQQQVLNQCQHRKVKAGTQLFKPGDSAGGMFGFVCGGVAVEISPTEREPNVASLIRPGGWFGSAAAFTGQRRRIGAKATRDSDLLYLPVTGVNAIVAENRLAWRYFILLGVGEFDTILVLCDDLMRRDHVQRFIAVLLDLAGARRGMSAGEIVDVDLGQEELANISNVARTTAGAILRDLERAGHVGLSYRRVRILAPDALEAMLIH